MDRSPVVAVGRLVDATATTIVLEVEEGIKGAKAGDRLVVSNEVYTTAPTCDMLVLSGSTGWALPEEARVLAVLDAPHPVDWLEDAGAQQGPDDAWWPAYRGSGILEISETQGTNTLTEADVNAVRAAAEDRGYETPGAPARPDGSAAPADASEGASTAGDPPVPLAAAEDDGGGSQRLWVALVGGAAVAVVVGGALWVVRRRA